MSNKDRDSCGDTVRDQTRAIDKDRYVFISPYIEIRIEVEIEIEIEKMI